MDHGVRHIGSYETAARRENKQPVTFDLNGETYTAGAALPGGVLLDMAALKQATDPLEKLKILGSFMDAVLIPEDAARFSAKLRDSQDPLDLQTAMAIMVDLMRELSGNPTASPSS